jgi:UDP-N-acetylmuramoyl-tripeptide--D-alanyl-D-alanine ligase
VESGARCKGDIEDISKLLNPQHIILGSIGEAHIEYFKSLENIINTKKEILLSRRLQKAYIHEDNNKYIKQDDSYEIDFYPTQLRIISSNLDGISFSLQIDGKEEVFNTRLLGVFNPQNISVAILLAYDFGVTLPVLKDVIKTLPFVSLRLEKIQTQSKIILDDSYNSNFIGMSEAINVSLSHKGRKVIVTCGLVESSTKLNSILACKIDEVFDIVIITSLLNVSIFKENIKKSKLIVLEDKSNIEDILLKESQKGDLVLFANDAPNYI